MIAVLLFLYNYMYYILVVYNILYNISFNIPIVYFYTFRKITIKLHKKLNWLQCSNNVQIKGYKIVTMPIEIDIDL